MRARDRSIILALFVASVIAFQVSTIRPGHDWGDDFAMYILHARNLVEGRGYADTGYIYNPRYASLGPQSYPPVFPALLAPVYRVAGLDFRAMKIVEILLFAGTLVVLYAAFRGILAYPVLMALIVVVGLHPWFWDIKDQVVSDIPFLLFTYLALLAISRWHVVGKLSSRQALRAGVTGVLICLAFGTRTIGIVLVLALVAWDLVRRRKPTQFTVIATGVFLAFSVVQGILLRGNAGYVDQLAGLTVRSVLSGTRYYLNVASMMWDNGVADLARKVLFILGAALALWGFARRIRDGITIFEVFFAGYLAAVLLWPSVQGERFLFPILPLFFLYAFIGIDALTASRGRAWNLSARAVFLSAILVTYAGRYATLDYGPIREGIAKAESVELFEYVRTQTPADAVLVFAKPRALALMTGRRAVANHVAADDTEMEAFLGRVHATYLVAGPRVLESPERDYLVGFIGRHPGQFQVAYANPDFTVYRQR